MYYYIAEVSKDLISIKRDESTEEYNTIEPHIKMISKMLVDKNRNRVEFLGSARFYYT